MAHRAAWRYAVGMYKQVLIPALTIVSMTVTLPVQAEDIYRWVDGSGQVHYSDVPRDGAEQVEIGPAQTFSAPVIARSSPSTTADTSSAAVYDALEIVSPAQEETIWNTGGVITVSVNPSPALMVGHSLRIYYDGKPVEGKAPRATSVQLSEVYRGEHQVSAEILSVTGQVLKQATPVTFFYKQNSTQNPARRTPPPPSPTN